ncbi:MAG: hypothetical protein IT246_00640 [Bacteroidia bacterium]|nr:hypothetical protein [Bacteroidia bacterium]
MNTIKDINVLIKKLDDTPEIYNTCFEDGFIIWTKIRYELFKHLLESLYLKRNEFKINSTSPKKFNFIDKLKSSLYLKYYLLWNSGKIDKNEFDCICINSSQTINRTDGKYIGKVNKLFNIIPDIKVLNIYNYSKNIKSNQYFGSYMLIDKIVQRAKIKSKIILSTNNKNILAIKNLMLILKQEFKSIKLDSRILDKIEKDLIKYERLHSQISYELIKLFIKTKPRFIAIEDGNYGGGLSSLIIFLATKMNIKTIEIQHGVFDIAFDYGQKLMNKTEFRMQKTDLLLTFGKYWNNWVNYPGKTYSVGNFILDEAIRKVECKTKYILFTSQGNHTLALLEIALEVSEEYNNTYKVIYKLHPKEYKELKNYQIKYKSYKNIEFIGNTDTYTLLSNASFVVGSFSTLLFEALYYKKTPLVYDDIFSSEYIPDEVGIKFKNTKELLALINNNCQQSELNYKYYWEYDCITKLNEIAIKENLW